MVPLFLNISNGIDHFTSKDTISITLDFDQFCETLKVCAYFLGSFLIIYYLYKLLFIPVNWIRDLTDIGYDHVVKATKRKDIRKEIINRVKRLRNVGNKLPPPYPNGWFVIAESKDVLPGKAIEATYLGHHFVVFRSESGEVNVLDAYCPHLGANLGVGGIVRGDCIECPFHHWSFRGSDGQCVNIPYSSPGCTIPKSAKLKKWVSIELNEAIFIWHHVENDIPWDLPVVQEIETNEWICYGRNEFTVNCHIQDIPENGADVAHLNVVHGPSMLSGSQIGQSDSIWSNMSAHVWEAEWKPCSEGLSHVAFMNLKHSIKILNTFHMFTMDVHVRQFGPGYVMLNISTSFGPVVILQGVTPTGPLTQKVVHRFYGPRLRAPFMKFLIWGESVMFERDVIVWNHKEYLCSPCLVKEDRTIKLFRNWYSQFYTENSKSFARSQENLDW